MTRDKKPKPPVIEVHEGRAYLKTEGYFRKTPTVILWSNILPLGSNPVIIKRVSEYLKAKVVFT